jgi:hypothetical protein
LKISSSAKGAVIWSIRVDYDIWDQLIQSEVHGELDHAVEETVSIPCCISMACHYGLLLLPLFMIEIMYQ